MGHSGEPINYYESIPSIIIKTAVITGILAVFLAGCFSCSQINEPNDLIINDVNNLVVFQHLDNN
ncbi:MAG: hypothetical protein GY863_05995 [bacterium]|nr:hypothetical protein [bacterium]